jgi:hypothetical protein
MLSNIMTTTKQLLHFATEVEELSAHVQVSFGAHSEQQLNWKPAADSWSVAQCLHHLITTNTVYFRTFDAIKSGNYAPTLLQRLPVVPKIIGGLVVSAIRRVPTTKVKTPSLFEPSKSTIAKEIIGGFGLHQVRFAEYLRGFAVIDAERVVVSLPQSGFAVLRLSDALTMLVNHEFRHVLQAEKVVKSVNFGIW